MDRVTVDYAETFRPNLLRAVNYIAFTAPLHHIGCRAALNPMWFRASRAYLLDTVLCFFTERYAGRVSNTMLSACAIFSSATGSVFP